MSESERPETPRGRMPYGTKYVKPTTGRHSAPDCKPIDGGPMPKDRLEYEAKRERERYPRRGDK